MRIPFLDLKKAYLREEKEIDEIFREVSASGRYLLGPRLEAFELALATDQRVNSSTIVACHSGTDALTLALLAQDIGAGDEVITPTNSAAPTAAAIRASGAEPVFCDVEEDTWLLSFESCLEQLTEKTKAVIPVHLYGNPVSISNLRSALDSCGRSEIKIIEDVAQGQGGFCDGATVGSQADFASFSFFPTKNLGAMGDGGALYARDPDSAQKARALRFYGQTTKNKAEIRRGINSRLDEFQSAILNFRIHTYRSQLDKKNYLRDLYLQQLSGLPVMRQSVTKGAVPGWHLFVIRLESNALRENLRAYLEHAGIETFVHYPFPLHLQAAFSRKTNWHLPIAEKLAGEILSLPFSPFHSEEDATEVCKAIRAFFDK